MLVIETPPPNSTSLCYVLAALLGDGYLYKQKSGAYSINLRVKDKKFVESFRENLIEIGLKPSKAYYERAANAWRVTAYCAPFYRWYKSLKVVDIRKIAEEYPVSFLRGFYEAEGCYGFYEGIRRKQYILSICNTNKKLLMLVSELLSSSGFLVGRGKSRYQTKNAMRRVLYIVTIKGGKKEIHRFFVLINPCIKCGEIEIDRTCRRCGINFTPKHPGQRYCRLECRRPKIESICPICKIKFIAKEHQWLCCSKECSKLYKQRYMREYMRHRYWSDLDFRRKIIELNS